MFHWTAPLPAVISAAFMLMMGSTCVTAHQIRGSSNVYVIREDCAIILPNGRRQVVSFYSSSRHGRRDAELKHDEDDQDLGSEEDLNEEEELRGLLWDNDNMDVYTVERPNGTTDKVRFIVSEDIVRRNEREDWDWNDGSLPYGKYKVILPNGQSQIATYSSTSEAGIEADIAAWASEIFNMQIHQEGRRDRGLQWDDKIPAFSNVRPSGSYRLNRPDGNYHIVTYHVVNNDP